VFTVNSSFRNWFFMRDVEIVFYVTRSETDRLIQLQAQNPKSRLLEYSLHKNRFSRSTLEPIRSIYFLFGHSRYASAARSNIKAALRIEKFEVQYLPRINVCPWLPRLTSRIRPQERVASPSPALVIHIKERINSRVFKTGRKGGMQGYNIRSD